MFELQPHTLTQGPLRRAKVIEFDAVQNRWRVSLAGSGQAAFATSVLCDASVLGFAREVVVAPGEDDELFIVGVLSAEHRPPAEVVGASGAGARLTSGPDGERVQVTSAAGELVLEYEPDSGKIRLVAPDGDVEIAAPAGAIAFSARDEVRLHGTGEVEMTSDRAVRMAAGQAATSVVSVQGGVVGIRGQAIGMASERANLNIDQLNVVGKRMRAKLDDARAVVKTLDVAVDVAKQKARRVYQKVEDLMQTKAGRMRSVVAHNYHLKGKFLMFKSEEDTKLKGKQIHLG